MKVQDKCEQICQQGTNGFILIKITSKIILQRFYFHILFFIPHTFQQKTYTQMIHHQIIGQPNSNFQQPSKVSHDSHLAKIFRLYSPTNTIRPQKIASSKQKHNKQKSVIQLVFPHPNLLFIHPQKITDPAEKHAFIELNIIKNIVQRKQKGQLKNTQNARPKPMTAPTINRRRQKKMNPLLAQNNQKQELVNVCTLTCDKQETSHNPYSSSLSWRKTKAFTSKTNFRKIHMSLKQNEEFNNSKQFKNKIINRNTFDFILEEKKKAITAKYDRDKLTRQNIYQKSLQSPKTRMYISMEGKFMKYFKKL